MATELQTQEIKAPALPRTRTEKELAALIFKHKGRILDALPQGVNGELVLKKAIFAIRSNRDLLKCTPASLFYAIADAISNGLEIGGIRREAYLVPYGSECVMLPGYRGLLELVRRSGELESCFVELVYEADHFEFELGDTPRLVHRPSGNPDREETDVTHVYFVATLKSGEKVRNVWTKRQVDEHRDRYSKAYQADQRYVAACKKKKQPVDESKLSPWSTNWRRMAFKTLIKDTINSGRLPMSESLQHVIERDNTLEAAAAPPVNQSAQDLDRILLESMGDDEADDTLSLPAGAVTEVNGQVINQRQAEPEFTEAAHEIAGVDWRYMGVGCDSLVGALDSCMNSAEVTVVEEYALGLAKDDDEAAWAKDQAEARRAQIREAKSEK